MRSVGVKKVNNWSRPVVIFKGFCGDGLSNHDGEKLLMLTSWMSGFEEGPFEEFFILINLLTRKN